MYHPLTTLKMQLAWLLAGLCLLVVFSASHAQSAPRATSRDFGQGLYRNALYLSQTYSLSGELTGVAKVAPVTASRLGYGAKVAVTRAAASTVAVMPRVSVANPTSREAAETTLSFWVSDNAARYTSGIGQWLRARSLSHALFTYSQEIKVISPTAAGGSKKMQIYWSGFVDSSGKAMYGRPQIIDADPLFVDVTYWPKTADSTLPSGWNYVNAGKAQWRLLNKNFEPITGYAEIDLNGIYDADLSEDEAPFNCFVDTRNSGCVPGFDVRKLILDYGATAAIVQYAQKLAPVYEAVDDGSESEDAEARPVVSYAYDDRVLMCDKLVNKGRIGYTLEANFEQYFVMPAEPVYDAQWIGHSTVSALSNPTDFELEVDKASLGTLHPSSVLLSPLRDGAIWPLTSAEAQRATYVSPYREEGSGLADINLTQGDVRVSTVSSGGSSSEIVFETVNQQVLPTGSHSRYFTFNLDNPSSLSQFALVGETYDDFIYVAVNERTVFAGPAVFDGKVNQMRGRTDAYMLPLTNSSNDSGLSQVRSDSNSAICFGTFSGGSWTDITGWGVGVGLRDAQCVTRFRDYGRVSANQYIDLRPYLRAGTNVVYVRAITYAGGRNDGFSLRFSAAQASCGASFTAPLLALPPTLPTIATNLWYGDLPYWRSEP